MHARKLASGFLWALLVFVAPTRAAEKVHVLALHAYSQEYPWTRGQHQGFMGVLNADASHIYDVRTEYLDTKRTAWTPAYAAETARHLREKYRGYQPTAIYVTDDNALSFALDHLPSLFPGVPVFFSGVNDYGIKARLDPSKVTGVFEKKEIAPNLALMRAIAPNNRHITIVGDASETHIAIEAELRKELQNHPGFKATFISTNNIEELTTQLKAQHARFVFLTTLGKLASADTPALTLRTSINDIIRSGDYVVFSMEDIYLKPGVLGGWLTSGPNQGMAAAGLLLRHLAGAPVETLAPIEKSPNEYRFDEQELARAGLVLPPDIKQQAAFINTQPGFYESHRELVLGTLYALGALLVLGMGTALWVFVRKNRLLAEVTHKQGESQRLLTAIIENELECVKLQDKQGNLLRINRAGLDMIEAESEAQVVGRPVADIILPPYRRAFVELGRRVFEGESGILEFEIQGIKGGRRWLETHAVPLCDESGQITRLLGVTRDITARKAAEAELESYRLGLENQVQARTAELETARDEAQRLMRVKSEFLANMSHEIRTPLNGVLGLARMGARDFAQQPVGVTFNRIIDAGAHLLNVINDILDISKLDAGKLAIEKRPFQLAAVFANAASFVSEGMQQKDLAYTTETPPDLPVWVMGDSMRVQQILVNLLSNAVKFTEQGEVRLKVTREGETLIFSVIDTGIGITPEHMDRLFTAFEQADNSTTRKYGGTGLGLAISRNLARMMGGEILVDSTPEHGSTFSLYLPLPEVAAPVERLPDSAGSTGQRLNHLRVLAAEDVEVNRLILEDLLTHEGAQVIFAEHGRQAIERLEEVGASAFDVVLMDVQMPIMDGYEATQRLHAIAPGLPVIGLTAHALEEERQRCLAAGMVAHVTKPIDEDELVAAILAQVSYLPQASPAPENRGEGKPAAVNGTMEDSPASAGEACIDWAAMHTRYQDKPAFVAKLIQTVRNSQADMPDKLRAAATSADLVTIAFLAHAVKGMAGNIFADKLQAMASKTEIAAKSGEATTNDKASELATALATALETLLDELGRTAL